MTIRVARSTLRSAVPLLAAASLIMVVSGCGGGGGGGDEAQTGAAANTVFAAPSGALCAAKDERGYCLQPTASVATAAQMLAVLNDPNGPQVRFEGVGQVLGFAWRSPGGGLFDVYRQTYDLARKTVVIGRQRVEIDGEVYRFTTFDGTRTYKFVNDADTSDVEVVLYTDEVLSIVQSAAVGQTVGSVSQVEGTAWKGEIGLLADRADAVTGNAVRYKGVIFALGGPGTPMPGGHGGQYLDGTSNGCDITLEFNAMTGVLRAEPTPCTGTGVQFNLVEEPTFDRSESQLKSAPLSTGVVTGAAISDAEDPAVSATFGATKFDGAFFGRGAKRLHLTGSNANGSFVIQAERQ
ncbi:hypothetical protein V4F39_17250 [Aquincola sp. MAHUQ-54]|uniref:Transferrin-binding protein B C-lobe/N-lobe beta barrel domain-containing protein n=1 Tax=Aquincola agrisoli TaxID=3119538 RepID=A0AAW9QKV1_9BURK